MPDLRRQLLAAFEVEHREHITAIRAAIDSARSGGLIDLREVFRRAHSLKGAARAVDLPEVESLAHGLEAVFADIQAGKRPLDDSVADATHAALDRIEAHVQDLLSGTVSAPAAADEAPAPAGEAAAPTLPGPEFLRVSGERVAALGGALRALSTDLQAQAGVADTLAELQGVLRGMERRWAGLRGRLPHAYAVQVRDFDRDLQGLSRGLAAVRSRQTRVGWSLEQAGARARHEVEQISLVSAETEFGALGRMVRDLARDAGVEVEVEVSGLETQAERRVLQALKDPLIHLLRNAIGHGVESPAERRAAGKAERARVGLAVRARAGRLEIVVRDDGRGPDPARIEAAAVERGLLAPRAPGRPAPAMDQLMALVFEPGLSTAQTVDKISGRGMGLSAVAEGVRALRGSVSLRPAAPHGTEAVLSVPLSAARQTVLLVEAGGQTWAAPDFAVERLVRIRADALEIVEGAPTARITLPGGDVICPMIPLLSLIDPARFATAGQIPVHDGMVSALLVRRGGRRCALAVDALNDVRTLVIEDVDGLAVDRGLVTGAILLEDDVPALVLDPEALIDRWVRGDGRFVTVGLGPEETVEPAAAPTILVVDDSITTRTLERSILEAQGFRVLLSVDGLDALNLLRSGQAIVDLVVADVEMPRMDGFSLLQAMKADAGLASIPVILMTSRAAEEDVRRGLELGAGAYITKQKFDQRELLATIGRLL